MRQDPGQHGGDGGLAVGSGDRDSSAAVQYACPNLGAMDDRDSGGTGLCELGIVLDDGGRRDDELRAVDVLLSVADVDGRAAPFELQGGIRGGQVGAGNGKALLKQVAGQRAHACAADSDEMDPFGEVH